MSEHGAAGCVFATIYQAVCGDPEAVPAIDGLIPKNTDLHAERFTKFNGEGDPRQRTGAGFDRLLWVEYDGIKEFAGVYSRKQMERKIRLKICVGYLFGGHEYATDAIIADDDADISKIVRNERLWPACGSGCIQGIVAINAKPTRISPDRKVSEIVVEATVIE